MLKVGKQIESRIRMNKANAQTENIWDFDWAEDGISNERDSSREANEGDYLRTNKINRQTRRNLLCLCLEESQRRQ